MKLTKLSLAAVIAVGALGSFASATPIEEAIKGVDVSGLVRYRYYYGTEFVAANHDFANNATVDKESYNRFSASLNVLTPVADAFSAGVSVMAEGGFNEAERQRGAIVNTGLAGVTGLDKAFFQYSANGITAKVGKFEIPTPWTESGYNGNRGNGILALYSGVPGWTFAGAYYNQVGDTVTDKLGAGERDLYALAAIGAVGPVTLQVWAAYNVQVFNAVYTEAVLNLNGIYAKGQVNWLKLDKNSGLGDEDGLFFGAEGGYKGQADNIAFNAVAGYTKNDK
ncbi:MAG: major outer membrane protein, partial [Campylobacteraceae bacterium]|nr:major outer membrane protein [Campylobacteraceae bacterium]